ncbi:MAG: hypothetical protein SLAVMIC_00767 [uncultured marine phage]|uniref:Uncharacterized protein n=1 Tax=uncultured marine phage TaxID=707152 RepID=A0A8D9CCR2_9VIRU|nr:MAG: hypothetical protein SLAVMIC_00767 [uncultured marine phage]
MNPILASIIFCVALAGSIYFFGKLVVWSISKLAPQNVEKQMTGKQILKYNLIMIFSIILWGILYFNSIT